jgi:small-conductance mechanosensitive channel/CRP-like cAMP-binding protein
VTEIWREPWFPGAVALAVALPVVLVVLTEVLGALVRRQSPAAKPVRLLRNFVVPIAAVFALLTFASSQSFDLTWVRIVGTVLGFLVILLLLSAFNVALFGNAREGSWRERLPSIFITLARLALIVVGLAVLFSWVWGADVGGLFAALGVTSIVIGLALQNAVGSVISGLLLLFEQPFKLGDHLDTGSVKGRVVEVNWRAVHIDTGNGIQIVPNASLAGGSFTNLSRTTAGFSAETTVKYTTDDAPQAVLAVLHEVASGLPMRDPARLPSVAYVGAATFTVQIPIVNPALEGDAVSLFLDWLWYASRRHDLALDGDSSDPVNNPETVADALAFVAPTVNIPLADVESLAGRCRIEQYGAGEIVQRVDVVPDSMRVVLEGHLQLSVPYGDGMLPVTRAERGEFVGQTALTRQRPVLAAVAGSPLVVLRFPSDVIDAVVRQHPQLARRIGETLDNRRRLAADALAAALAEPLAPVPTTPGPPAPARVRLEG